MGVSGERIDKTWTSASLTTKGREDMMQSLGGVSLGAFRRGVPLQLSRATTRMMSVVPPQHATEEYKDALKGLSGKENEGKPPQQGDGMKSYADMSRRKDWNAVSRRGESREEAPHIVDPIPDPKPLLFGLKPGEAESLDLSPAMMRVVDVVNGSQAQIERLKRRGVTEEFQRHKSDTGSPEVQVALMSSRIARLASHIKEHHHDHHSRRGLVGLVNSRRRLMKYMKRTDPETYARVLSQLNLRDAVVDKK